MKISLAELNIYGPKGNPNADAGVTKYTEMPWEEFQEEKRGAASKIDPQATHGLEGSYNLSDKNAAISKCNLNPLVADALIVPVFLVIVDDASDVFGEGGQVCLCLYHCIYH